MKWWQEALDLVTRENARGWRRVVQWIIWAGPLVALFLLMLWSESH